MDNFRTSHDPHGSIPAISRGGVCAKCGRTVRNYEGYRPMVTSRHVFCSVRHYDEWRTDNPEVWNAYYGQRM